MLMMLAGFVWCWNVPQLMLVVLVVLRLMMERTATEAHDACWSVFVLERAAADAHDARCFVAHDGTCGG